MMTTLLRTKTQSFLLSCLFLLLSISPSWAQPDIDGVIDDPGDIMFVGFSINGNDGFSFVVVDDIPNGQAIVFTDDEWSGTAFPNPNNEGDVTWTNNTGGTISAGTVVHITSAMDSPSASIGTATESDLGFNLTTLENIYAFTGSRAAPNFLTFISGNSAGLSGSLSGTNLVSGTTALILDASTNFPAFGVSNQNLVYTGATTCNGTLTDCLQNIYNLANWGVDNTTYPSSAPNSFSGTVFGSCVDAASPTIDCPTPQEGVLDANCNFQVIDYTGLATTSDDCGPVTVTQSPTAGQTYFGVGITQVVLTATDGAGNTATCNMELSNVDKIPPLLQCANLTFNNAPGSCGASISLPPNAGMDNCDPNPSVTYNPTDANPFPVGSTPVIATVSDISGNTSTCAFSVIINDTEPPNAVCQNGTVQLDGSGNGSINASALDGGTMDNCPGAISYIPTSFGFNCSNVGPNTVTVSVVDVSFNSTFCTAVVTVQDNMPPTAICKDATVVLSGTSATLSASQVDGGSTDNCPPIARSVTPNMFTCSDVGFNPVTLLVIETSGGIGFATCTAAVTVEEDPNNPCCTGPVAVCNAVTVQLDNLGDGSASASAVGAGSTADCGLASETVNPSDFDCDDVGPNTVTYTITDINGASASCTAVVTVEDNVAPVPTCVNSTVQLDANGDGSLAPSAIHGGSMEACGFLPLSASPTSFNCSDVGTVIVTLTVSDVNGNSATCTASVDVEDNVPPVANCQDATVTLNANGVGTLPVLAVYIGPPSDACGIASASVSPASFDCDDLGGHTVTLETTDNNGNSATCTATATVEDNLPPVAVCLNNTVFLDPSGNYTLQDVDVLDFILSSDNCDNFSVIDIDPASVSCDQEGMTLPVEVTIEDDSGNPDMCTAMISVEQGTALPAPWTANDVGGSNGSAEFKPCDGLGGKFTIDAMGFSLPNSDKQEFVSQTLCGTNAELIARVCGVTGGGWAGIQMRETLAPGSKKVVLKTQLTPIVRRDFRQSTNGFAQSLNIPRPFQDPWLRLVRQGNFFIGYTSVNGINWQFTFYAFVPMSSCIEVGLYVESINVNTTTTGQFDNVLVNGSPVNPLAAPTAGLDIAFAPTEVPTELINLYPNPSSGEVFVELGAYQGQKASIQVFNNLGQAVKLLEVDEIQIPTQRLDLSGYRNGLYFIKIQIPDQPEVTRKLMLMGEQ